MNNGWKQRPEAGTSTALKATVWLSTRLGRRISQLLAAPVAFYFLLVRGEERRASRKFLGLVMGKQATTVEVFLHFYTFAKVTIDRIFFLTDRADKISFRLHHAKLFDELTQQQKGGIFLASHLGSFEAARSIAHMNKNFSIRMVLDRSVNMRLIDTLESLNPGFAASLIDANQSASSLGIEIAETAREGTWVGFLADRYMSGDRTTQVDFMGAKAQLPLGPFIVASVLHLPVFVVFPLYIDNGYKLFCELISEDIYIDRSNREEELNKLAQSYANRLEHYTKLAPYNWFNFYDFWETDK
jgi:predicted LPLAT superfamily acyltransferase